MKKRILLFWGLCLLAQWGMAQAPKWMEKAKRSVFSVITYDQDDKILNTGNGFFVTEDGIALSDYSLFKDAKRAVIVNSEGEQMPVEAIMGADDMYDVVKFKVAITGKKVPALQVVAASPAVGADAYLLPYSTRKDRSYTAGKVKAVDKVADNNDYYTLDMHLTDKMVSCPLVTADGLAFGMVQKSSGPEITVHPQRMMPATTEFAKTEFSTLTTAPLVLPVSAATRASAPLRIMQPVTLSSADLT